MSWCTAEEVTNLINDSRLRPDVLEAERKTADSRFIELHASAVNIGDVLAEVVVATDRVSYGVRLAAALALESLVTERAWRESRSFSDKNRVVGALVAFLRHDSSAENRIRGLVCSCLCRVICLEYPAVHWDALMDECVTTIVAGDVPQKKCASMHYAVVLRLAEVCGVNATLWWRMASGTVRRLLEWATAAGRGEEPRAVCLRVVSYLLKRRPPRRNETTEAERPKNSFIFSGEFRRFLSESLEYRMTTCEFGELCGSFLEEYGLLLNVAQHLIGDAVFAELVFRASICLLGRCEAVYVTDAEEGTLGVIACVDSALECLIGVLQTFPEVSLVCDDVKLFSTLFSYMTRAVTIEQRDEAALLDALQEDCVVPLGCAGGDTASNAAAALELFVEVTPRLLGVAVEFLCDAVAGLQQGADSAHWRAWTTALRSLCRVCEEKALSLTDSLSDAAGRLLSPLALLLRQTVDPLAAVELIDLLTLCLMRATQVSVYRAFFSILDTAFDGADDNLSQERLLLLAVAVYAVHRLLSTCAPSLVPGDLCNATVWLQRALVLMSRGGPLSVYCGTHAVMTLLCAAPHCTVPPASLVLAAVDNACRRCDMPNASLLLAGLMWSLCSHAPGDCGLAAELLQLVVSHCRHDSPHRAGLLRCLTDYVLRLSKAYLQKIGCLQCVPALLHHCLPGVLWFAVEDAPHDEATTRFLSNSLATAASSGLVGVMCERIVAALADVLRSAVHEHHSSTTLSKVVAAMSTAALAWPTFLDGDMMTAVLFVFSSLNVTSAKGLNYVGCCLLPALFCIRHPGQVDDIAVGCATTPLHTHLTWGTMLGVLSSVAPFADHFTTMYFLAAWLRLLRYATATRGEGRDVLMMVVPSCTVYCLPSLHVKSVPKKRLEGCSLAQCIAAGLALVLQRGKKVARVKLFDEEVLLPLTINQRFGELANCGIHDSGVDALLSRSLEEGAHWLLEVMTADGYGPQVDAALRFAAEL